jgi:aryl sulfotransferase
MGEGMPRYRSLITDNARWEGFTFRAGDIVISTPPKCGTTWTQMLCALLVFQDPVLPGPLTELSPWVDVLTRKVADVFAALEAQEHRRFIKSHTPFDGLPHDDRVTYIGVGRDPRDAAVSWDNHFNNMKLDVIITKRADAVGLDDLAELYPNGLPEPIADPVDRFWHWVDDDEITDGVSGLVGLVHHLHTFWERRDDANVELFHYADLQADLPTEMRRLAAALDIEVDDDLWPKLITAATFDEMRQRAEHLAPQVTDDFWHSTDRFFAEGTTGKWHGFFGPGDQERYDTRIQELAPDLEFRTWLHGGSRALAGR